MLSQQIKRQSVRCYCNLVAALYQRFNDGYTSCGVPKAPVEYTVQYFFAGGKAIGMQSIYR